MTNTFSMIDKMQMLLLLFLLLIFLRESEQNPILVTINVTVLDHHTVCLEEGTLYPVCHMLLTEIDEFTPEVFKSIVSSLNEDQETSIRRINITLNQNVVSYPNIPMVAASIDEFLAPRPWWYIVQEPFEWHKDNEKIRSITFDRIPTKPWENPLQKLAAFSFKSLEECQKSMILIMRKGMVHPGWFSSLVFYTMAWRRFGNVISSGFFAREESIAPREQQGFMHDNDCNLNNKWSCAFLPTTSCIIPKYITECTKPSDECFNAKTSLDMLILDKADINGQPVTAEPAKSTMPWNSISDGLVDFGYLLRPSSQYRSRISELMDHFYRKYNNSNNNYFNRNSRCVTAHFRRGDRTITSDIKEYCYNYSHNLPCRTTPTGGLGTCNGDMGCPKTLQDSARVAFGSLNLKHIVSHVAPLVGNDVKNIVAFSDDVPWLRQEIALLKRLDPTWNVLILEGPQILKKEKYENSSTEQINDTKRVLVREIEGSKTSTEHGSYLFASLELAAQCEGFIGHLGSGATQLFYRRMCYYHSGKEKFDVCPPTYDLRKLATPQGIPAG